MNKKPDPTPRELALACAEIQSHWGADERLRRLRSDERPMVKAADGRLVAMAADDYVTHISGNTQ